MKENNSSNTGISGATLLQIALIVLKLCHVIDWKRVWVLLPTWGAFALVIAFILFAWWLNNQ
jgi:hypothetical protein